MNLPYVLRLTVLCLASFYLIHAAMAVILAMLSPRLIRLASVLRPRVAARLLLIARLAPGGVALLAIACACLPSYLLFEPDATAEPVGAFCLVASGLGALAIAQSIARGLRARAQTSRYLLQKPPLIALAGIIRPRVLVSTAVAETLPAAELAIAVDHERAHARAHDNLKRLLLRLSPNAMPLGSGWSRLDEAWSRFTEWAADDEAVSGDPQRSLLLASALVHVARMHGPVRTTPLMSTLLDDRCGLAERVERLLNPRPAGDSPRFLVPALGLMAVIAAVSLVQPVTIAAVHGMLELLIR